ncbi:GNAT family N-acetyltransferase [Floricoccus penangensis]|uniref:GNAT family N-acetyltransferase n=1 Tax=Floricoccus penangensis TaxID=1859475 RepID=A0A9Q5JGH8_9LACT|nr:GNAT family N-acetyltransferase [Floricoccus penangensis]OFI46901.1 GNAT family N-acetyltransferase [Floricoccus penangensis]
MNNKIVSNRSLEKRLVSAFFKKHWGNSKMVISTGTYDCNDLDGYALLNDSNEIIALITYVLKESYCEIISLDSIIEGEGSGSKLINKVEKTASENRCSKIRLITTNDNLNALRFYQKRGYRLEKIYKNAVTNARKIKKEIPKFGYHGIPLVDEIELVKTIK